MVLNEETGAIEIISSPGVQQGGVNGAPSVPLINCEGEADCLRKLKRRTSYGPEPGLDVLFDSYGGVVAASQALAAAAASAPDDPVLWAELGNAHRAMGDAPTAVACFEAALRLQPHPDYYLNLGSVRAATGELEEASRLFAMGLQLNPRHSLLQFAAGAAHAAAGRADEASRSFEAVLKVQPDFVAARQYLDVLRAESPLWWHSTGYLAAALTVAAAALAAAQQGISFMLLRGNPDVRWDAGSDGSGALGGGGGGGDGSGKGGGKGGGSDAPGVRRQRSRDRQSRKHNNAR